MNRGDGKTDPASLPDNWLMFSLAGLCCEAAGGEASQADPVISAWGSFYLAAHGFDDIADGDVSSDQLSAKLMLSVASFASAGLFLSELGPPLVMHPTAQAIQQDFYRSVLKACIGQVKDLKAIDISLDQAWAITEAKTGEPYALACRTGARLASDDHGRITAFGEFGLHLGILMQIGDDIQGINPEGDTRSDLARGKRTLPVAYLIDVVPTPERQQIISLLKQAQLDPSSERMLREAIIRNGALVYLATEAEFHRHQAATALKHAAPTRTAYQKLLAVLNQVTPFTQIEKT